MKNKNKLFGLIVIATVMVFSMIGCGPLEEKTTGGTFTLTNIPSAYDGKFAGLWAENIFAGSELQGSSTDPGDGVRYISIINGEVKIPLYVKSSGKRFSEDGGLYGSDYSVRVRIYNGDTPDTDNEFIASWVREKNVTFSKGSAKMSWEDGSHTE